MWRCTSSTMASVKNPRATPDWFVIITIRNPGPIQGANRVDRHGYSSTRSTPIEVADFLDERAVTIEKDRPDRRVTDDPRRRVSTRIDRDAAHAAMSQRAFAQHARTAPDRMGQHRGVGRRSDGSRARRSDRTSRSRGRPRAAAKVHGARVVRDERAAVRRARRRASADRSVQSGDQTAPGTPIAPIRTPGRRGTIGRAADQDRPAHRRAASASIERRERCRRPAFRAAKRRARRERDQRRASIPPCSRADARAPRRDVRPTPRAAARSSDLHAKPSARTRCR